MKCQQGDQLRSITLHVAPSQVKRTKTHNSRKLRIECTDPLSLWGGGRVNGFLQLQMRRLHFTLWPTKSHMNCDFFPLSCDSPLADKDLILLSRHPPRFSSSSSWGQAEFSPKNETERTQALFENCAQKVRIYKLLNEPIWR